MWILDVAAIPHTKQIVLFAAAKGQFESSDNLVYGLGKKRQEWKKKKQYNPHRIVSPFTISFNII